jgi:uncharacterized SAM-binding protein YcdF (DUF218 family)
MFPTDLFKKEVDWDAFLVFLLSCLMLVASLGTLYLLLLFKVVRQAATAGISADGDGIYLVFGKKLVGGSVDEDYRRRLDRLLRLPYQTTILLGGDTGGPMSEAQAGREYLERRGFALSHLHLEEKSKNTLENLKNARRMIALWQGRLVIIVSNRYHLLRCGVLADSLGFSYGLCAAEGCFRCDVATVKKCLNEAFFLHWFYTGKYWARLTRNRRMLDRIT